jgi:glycosyltransferase involved in cell wall biosynthesis
MSEGLVIAHVLSSFGRGGQERVAADLARLHRASGHEVLAVSLAGGDDGPMAEVLRAGGVATATLAKGPRVDPSLPWRLAAHFRRYRVDVVHTHNPQALVYGAPAASLAGAVAVHSKHGMNPDGARRLWLRRAAATFVDAYVAVTPKLAARAIEQGDCDPARLRVVANGIDVARFAPSPGARNDVRRELGIPDDAWVVGTVGRLSPEKNHALLVEAMAPLLDARRRLVVAGDGPQRAELERTVATCPGGRWVHLTGHRDDADRVLAALDAFALSSRTEGLPLALLEAMATGLPVVSTCVGGISDLLRHEVTGLLVPEGEREALTRELAALSASPTLSRRLGEAGRREVLDRHSVDRMARSYGELYAIALRERHSGRQRPCAVYSDISERAKQRRFS